MKEQEGLTRLVVGTSEFGERLLRQKVGGIIVASLAFACGLGFAYALKTETTVTPAVVVASPPAAHAGAEVSIRDTSEADAHGRCPKR